MITGFGGEVIRDAMMGDMPLSFKGGSNYTTSAFFRAASFYLLMFINIDFAMAVSITSTSIIREIFSPFGIYKKIIKNNESLKFDKVS